MPALPSRLTLATTALLCLGPGGPLPLAAQEPPAPDSAVVRVETRYRWLHQDARPGSVPFEEENHEYRVTRHTFPGWEGYVEIDRGAIEIQANWDRREAPASVTVLELRQAGSARSGAGEQSVALQLSGHRRGQRPILHLPETIAWEMLVPAPAELSPGDRWTDTLDFHSVPMDSVQEHFGGVWRYEVDGDTVLGGKALPRVRFEADVQVRRLRALEDPTRRSHLQLERVASGRMTGWFVLDTLNGIRLEGVDSTRLSGMATLRGADRPDRTSDVVYEQHRRWIAVTEEREAARAAAWERSYGGMLVAPEPPPETPPSPERVDSLWSALTGSDDPDRRWQLRDELMWITDGDPAEIDAEEAARLLAQGDPIPTLRALLGQAGGLRLDSPSWALYRPYLDEPERLWRLGLPPHGAWNTLAEALLWSAPWSGQPESEWVCVPEDCPDIVAEMSASPNAMLRETALVGRFAESPSTGYPALERAWEGGAEQLGEAVRFARGVGAHWPAAPKTPMPGPGAPWREWQEWMGGEVRFERSHRRALAVYEARTGRDPLADLASRWNTLEDDSARLVVGTILRSAGRLEPRTPEELIRDLLGDSEPLRGAAQWELAQLDESLEPIPDAEAVELLEPLLDSIVVFGTSPWRSVPPEAHRFELGQGFHGLGDGTRYLVYDPAEEALVRSLAEAAGLEARSREEWEGMDRRSAAVGLFLERPDRWGEVIRLHWSWSAWAERDDDAVPRGYGGGGTIWLVPSENGWVTVNQAGWIT